MLRAVYHGLDSKYERPTAFEVTNGIIVIGCVKRERGQAAGVR